MAEETKRVEPTIGDTAAATDVATTPPKPKEEAFDGITRELPPSQAPVAKKPAPVEAAPTQQEDTAPGNLSSVNSKLCNTLNNAWGIGAFDSSILASYVHGDDVKLKGDGSLKFKLKNGDDLNWRINTRADGTQFESITMDGGHFGLRKMTQESADAMIAVAVTKGWEAINVSVGVVANPIANKEMMWLAAQSAGLEVSNFEPLPDSKIWDKLKQRNPERYEELINKDKVQTGISTEIPVNSKFGAPKQDASAPEEKAQEAKAAAPIKPTFNEWLDARAAEAKSPTEAEGFKIMSRAVSSGAIKLDELEQKSIQTQYKPRVREGVMEADGKGYNRVVETFAAKGVTAAQKVPEQEIIAAAPKVSAPPPPKA